LPSKSLLSPNITMTSNTDGNPTLEELSPSTQIPVNPSPEEPRSSLN